jgi:hypothetical protein
MPHKSVTPCNPAGVSTVCTAMLLCVVTFSLLQHQTAAEETRCAVGCRCYDSIANCSQLGIGAVPYWSILNIILLELDLSGNNIECLNKSDLRGYNTVRNMSFRNNKIKNVHGLAFQGLSEELMYLDLSSNLIRKFDSATFSYIPKQKVLLISNNCIGVLHKPCSLT